MAEQAIQTADVQETLQRYFGFEALRPGQDEVVEAVMQGRDALAIMPTGGGKSLCYQLPALCRSGLTVVVSPLIALMKDQVDALQARGIAAAALNSSLGAEEYRQVLHALRSGDLRILYVAPERFGQESFMSTLRGIQVGLLAIDEAHCLSQWGHDFRPDYLRLGRARHELGDPQTIALTATATAHVRQDILDTLRLQNPAVTISGFARENLDFAIVHCDTRKAKFDRIRQVVDRWKTGIIYCSTRKNVMLVFEELQAQRINAVAYHAGMTDEEREFSQNAFISRRADVVVATNAFGMGIDRADVRFVIHFEIPGSVEAYYQEAGRAGRDGDCAVCELLFNHADLKTQEFFYQGSNPDISLVEKLYGILCKECDPQTHELQMSVDDLGGMLGYDTNPMAAGTALSILLRAGAISRTDVPGSRIRCTRVLDPAKPFSMLDIDRNALAEKATRDHCKIEAITHFAYSVGCRQQWILDYFGEQGGEPCGHCDVCRAQEPAEAEELTEAELTTVIKALSGVARASRRENGAWQAVYGRAKIMDMLRGAKNASMHRYLTSLSTYGLLSDFTVDKMKALFRAMQRARLLQTTGGEMPLLTLSPKGERVMKRQESVRMVTAGWSKPAPAKNAADLAKRSQTVLQGIALGRMDRALFSLLADLRRDIAAEYNMPVFRVISTDTLRAMASVKPTTIESAEKLKGVGPWVRSHCLRDFVNLISEYEGL